MKISRYARQILVYIMLSIFIAVGLLIGCSSSDIEEFLPDVSVSPTALDFQRATVGEPGLKTVTIKNLNTIEDIIIERVTSTNEVFQVGGYFSEGELIPLNTPITIEGNGARVIYVGFYPDEAGSYEGTLVVESLDSEENSETDLIALTGTLAAEETTE